MTKLISWLHELRGKSRVRALKVIDGVVEIFNEDEMEATIPLRDVSEIVAFKRDLLTVDMVCFEIRVVRNGDAVLFEVDEEMPGFDNLLLELKQYPGFEQDWRNDVILPPFAENRTVIFQQTA